METDHDRTVPSHVTAVRVALGVSPNTAKAVPRDVSGEASRNTTVPVLMSRSAPQPSTWHGTFVPYGVQRIAWQRSIRGLSAVPRPWAAFSGLLDGPATAFYPNEECGELSGTMKK